VRVERLKKRYERKDIKKRKDLLSGGERGRNDPDEEKNVLFIEERRRKGLKWGRLRSGMRGGPH